MVVTPESQFCVEGFPRSANTYAVAAMLVSQSISIEVIARHTHLVGQVRRAIQMSVPTMILIRNPAEAAVSLKLFAPYLSLRQCLRAYERFYSGLLQYKDDLVIAKFEQVTDDYNEVLKQMNHKFGLDLKSFDKATMEVEVFDLVEQLDKRIHRNNLTNEFTVARPSERRRDLKKGMLEELGHNEYQSILDRCQNIYEAYIS